MESTSNWFSWAMLSAVFAALTAIFAKIGLEGVNSDLATLLRTFVIVLVLTALVGFTGKWSNPFLLNPKTLFFIVASALATGASWICYFRALQAGPASKVSAVDKSSLVLVALFAVLFLKERPAGKDWIGIFMVAGGVLLLGLKR